jgi:hypothetical protein
MLSFIATVAICIGTFFLWRINEQMPDVLFRLTEIQRDLAAARRELADD